MDATDRVSQSWIQPQWPAPLSVRAVCTVRHGSGASMAPYGDFNLADHVGDDPAAVLANRRRFEASLCARPVFMSQVHGSAVVPLHAVTPDGIEGDACFTSRRGLACTIQVADCLPVLLCDVAGTVVGAAHAGWRGLAAGVLSAAAAALGQGERLAWLGPCIGPEAFEVGPEVRAAFLEGDPGCAPLFVPYGAAKFLADLPALARRSLVHAGVRHIFGNDGSRGWCTVANPERFYSYRRDGRTGRFAASIWIER